MSAITGIGDSFTIRSSALTSSSRGTAQRTRSPPASAMAWICFMVASKSAVSVLVMDCTATGAPPPILTPPTSICFLEAMNRPRSLAGRASTTGGSALTAHVSPFGGREARLPSSRASIGDPGRVLGLRALGLWRVWLLGPALGAGLAGGQVATGDDGARGQAGRERRHVHIHRVALGRIRVERRRLA